MGAFHAYDIRGVYNQDFDKNTAYKIGFFLPELIECDYVVVGRDVRQSSQEIFDYLTKGITDRGKDVWDIGLATTPLVYFATNYLNAGASVQITASHNPKQYNGMKISRAKAIPVGGDTGLKDLEQMVNTKEVKPVEKKGKIIKKDIYDAYLEFQRKFIPDLSSLNISIDASNGMSSLFVHKLFGEKNVHYINDVLDGTFPNHEPNPLEEKNCKQIEQAVLQNKSDCGIIYDGDADRVIFIDEKGRFIQPDFTTSIICDYYLRREKDPSFLVDIRTSRSSTEYLKKNGAKDVVIWKVGHAFAKNKIRELSLVAGGELAGHYYFRDFFNCDSGILASLLVLQGVVRLKKEGKTLGQFIDELVVYANSGECNFKLDQKDECIKAMYDKYSAMKPTRILDFDGYRIEFDSWWFSVRKSNTEPYLRLIVEAKTKEEMDLRMTELKSIIGNFK